MKLGTLKEVAAAAAKAFGEVGEIHNQTVSFSDRRSAGDDYPPKELRDSMKADADIVLAMFSNVSVSYEAVDEWYNVTLKVLPHARRETPDWSNKRVLAFMEKTITEDVKLMPKYHKVECRMMQVTNGYPFLAAHYGPKWNNYDGLEMHLSGDCETGWEIIARFGATKLTHKVTTDRGLPQTVWRKLKAAHASTPKP